jgi:hypothetical protein
MKTTLIVRGFGDGRLQFEDEVYIDPCDPCAVATLAARHIRQLASYRTHMIELEFLGEADPEKRFFRFGTDPRLFLRNAN